MSTASVAPRRVANRACDSCRRRKAKCDYVNSRCSNCHVRGKQCTFDLPQGKRGPKTNRLPARLLGDFSIESPPTSVSFVGTDSDAGNGTIAAESSGPESHPAQAASTSSHWVPSDSLELSPHAASVSVYEISSAHHSSESVDRGPTSPLLSAFKQWIDLGNVVQAALPDLTMDGITMKCVNLFFEYLFPLIPLVHEASLRNALDFFITASRNDSEGSAPSPAMSQSQLWISPVQRDKNSTNLSKFSDLWPESTFTLITAVCAEAAFLLPKEIFPEGYIVADAFLHASRSCLNRYLESDLENPSASSVAIRYFHSNCLHAAGKPKFSWHIFGEAVRLTEVMLLQDESSHDEFYPLEAELRRRLFWIVYIGDKSAATLNNRPITIHKFSFESGISTVYPSGVGCHSSNISSPQQELLDEPTPLSAPTSLDPDLIAGFNANLRLWHMASDLLLEMRLVQDRRDNCPAQEKLVPLSDERARIETLYIRFATSLDNLPQHLQPENVILQAETSQGGSICQFIIQIVNLQVSYHCLRMVIMQKLGEMDFLPAELQQPEILALRMTEVARDMLRIIRHVPFWALQVNGEPCVEKIRLVGASLLAIIHRNHMSPISTRARSDFAVLLDILTRLDSKASDTLRNGSSWIP